MFRKQSSTGNPITFVMVQSADGVSPLTGATPTVVLSKNGGAFAAAAGTVSEIGNGLYALAGNATDRNTLGELVLHATATGGVPTDVKVNIIPFDIFSQTDFWVQTFAMDLGTLQGVGTVGRYFGQLWSIFRGRWGIAGTTRTQYKVDDATVDFTSTVTPDGQGRVTADDPT